MLLLALIVLALSTPLSAWTLDGHRSIALDALAVLPPRMQEALASHVSVESQDPDYFPSRDTATTQKWGG